MYKGAVDDVEKSKRTVTSVITTDAIDRHGEDDRWPKGVRLDGFREPTRSSSGATTRPVVIAKNLWIKRDTKDGRTRPGRQDPVCQNRQGRGGLSNFTSGGFLNGWSIGARPGLVGSLANLTAEEELRARPDLKLCRRDLPESGPQRILRRARSPPTRTHWATRSAKASEPRASPRDRAGRAVGAARRRRGRAGSEDRGTARLAPGPAPTGRPDVRSRSPGPRPDGRWSCRMTRPEVGRRAGRDRDHVGPC